MGEGVHKEREDGLVLEGTKRQRGLCVGDLRQIQGGVRPRVSEGEGMGVGEHVIMNEGDREWV